MPLYGKNIIEAQMFSRELLEQVIFPLADEMRDVVERGGDKDLEDKRMITFFYEPSTRTRASFEMAMKFLGGEVSFSTENARIFSSVAKGETLEDTIKVLNGYHPDVIVLRSDDNGMAQRAADVSDVPIINAGDGIGEHPTQALLDLYTIQKELGRINGISIAMVGDLKMGRTVHSLARLLTKFKNVKIYFISPHGFQIGNNIKKYLQEHDTYWIEFIGYNLADMDISKFDVIYQTRIQKERRENDILQEALIKGFDLNINKDILNRMNADSIIMHPLPRNEEISTETDLDRRAAYFRQAENGLYVRMALLKLILEKPSGNGCIIKDMAVDDFERGFLRLPMAAGSQMKH